MAADPPLALVVDDDPVLRMLVTRSAEQAGYAVTEVGSLGELERVLPAAAPHLVVLDLNLGDAGGAALLRRVAQLGCRATVLLLTGLSEWDLAPLVELGHSLGLSLAPSLRKPVSSATLQAALAALRP